MLQYVVSSHLSLINRVAVEVATSTVLRIEGLQASSSPGTLESSAKSCRLLGRYIQYSWKYLQGLNFTSKIKTTNYNYKWGVAIGLLEGIAMNREMKQEINLRN